MEIQKEALIAKSYETIDVAKTMLYNGKIDTNQVREVLNELLKEIEEFSDLKQNVVTFNSDVEQILFFTSVLDVDKYTFEAIPLHIIYYYLGLADLDDKNYDDAITNFTTSIKFNPFAFRSFFKLAECYRQINSLDEMQKTLLENHIFIYDLRGLSGFYSRLGDCYLEAKKYALANALYSYSNYYMEDVYNISQLTKIASLEVRTVRNDTLEDTRKILIENKIPISVTKEMMKQLLDAYKVQVDSKASVTIRNQFQKILYDITKNESFADLRTIKCENIGFFFSVPENWEIMDNKGTAGGNTLFVINLDNKCTINIENLGECTVVGSNSKYQEIKATVLQKGFEIVTDSVIKNKTYSYIQSFEKKIVLNDAIIIVHNYICINDHLLDINVPIENCNLLGDALYKDKNVVRTNNLISSIEVKGN